MRHRQSTGLLKEVLDELRSQGMMRCSMCKDIKNKGHFHEREFNKLDYPYCVECRAFSRNKARKSRFEYELLKKYNLTIQGYSELFDKQNGRCAICKNIEDFPNPYTGAPISLAVDHCHKTNKVRGLLCRNCNLMIGNAKDSPLILSEAIKYLLENQ